MTRQVVWCLFLVAAWGCEQKAPVVAPMPMPAGHQHTSYPEHLFSVPRWTDFDPKLDVAAMSDAEAEDIETRLAAESEEVAQFPRDPEIPTKIEFYRRCAPMFLKQADEYRTRTTDPGPLREAARQLILDVFRQTSWLGDKAWSELVTEGQRLKDAGCGDPVFLYALSRAYRAADEKDLELVALRAAEVKFVESPYSAFEKLQNTLHLVEIPGAVEASAQAAMRERVRTLCTEWLKAERPQPELVDGVFEWIEAVMQVLRIKELEGFYRDLREIPDFDSWLLAMCSGRYQSRVAWHFRGTGFANTVSPQAAQQFERHNQLARGHYLQAWKLRPEFANPGAFLIGLAMTGQTQSSPRQWFDRTIRRCLDFDGAYAHYINSIRSRWGGSEDGLREFAAECVATRRFDTDVPFFGFYALQQIETDRKLEVEEYWRDPSVVAVSAAPPEPQSLWRDPAMYAIAKDVFENYEREPSRADHKCLFRPQRQTMLEHLAVALLAEQPADAVRLQAALGDRLPKAWRKSGKRRFAMSRAAAMASDAVEKLRSAETLALQTPRNVAHLEQALKDFQELEPTINAEHAKLYLRESITQLRQELAFQNGEWVPLTFHEDFINWDVEAGDWIAEDDRSAVGSCRTGERGLRMLCRGAFDGPKEAEVETEEIELREAHAGVLDPDDPMSSFVMYPWPQGGFALLNWNAGLAPGIKTGKSHYRGAVFWSDAFSKSAGVFIAPNQTQGFPGKSASPSRLHVRLWPQAAEFTVNQKMISPLPHADWLPDGQIVLASTVNCSGRVRFRNLRLRKLAYGPPPQTDSEDFAAAIEYYSRAITDNPDYPHLYLLRGAYQIYARDGAKAKADLEHALKLDKSLLGLAAYYALALQMAGDYENAEKQLLLAVEQQPTQPFPLLSLAEHYAASPRSDLRQPKRALEYAKRAISLSPRPEPSFQLILATAHAANGDYKEAVRLCQEALPVETREFAKKEIQERLDLFKAKKPYVFPAPKSSVR